eukprot:4414292-Prymnesium_polylepis.1
MWSTGAQTRQSESQQRSSVRAHTGTQLQHSSVTLWRANRTGSSPNLSVLSVMCHNPLLSTGRQRKLQMSFRPMTEPPVPFTTSRLSS